VPGDQKVELEQLAQYVLRKAFSVEKMTMECLTHTAIYRPRLNAKINRHFEVFLPTDLSAPSRSTSPRKARNGPLL
jgi:hypothetical protein